MIDEQDRLWQLTLRQLNERIWKLDNSIRKLRGDTDHKRKLQAQRAEYYYERDERIWK